MRMPNMQMNHGMQPIKLKAFPPHGEAHMSMPVILSKPGDSEALFPKTPLADSRYIVELVCNDNVCELKDFEWNGPKVLRVLLPPYMFSANHPHSVSTSCFLKITEVALRADPPLIFEYNYHHSESLDGVNMLEGLTTILKGLIPPSMAATSAGEMSYENTPAEAGPADEAAERNLEIITGALMNHVRFSLPEAVQQLKSRRQGLSDWHVAAKKHNLRLASKFIELLLNYMTTDDNLQQLAAPMTDGPVLENSAWDKLFLAVCCMAEMGVRFVPLLWFIYMESRAGLLAQPQSGRLPIAPTVARPVAKPVVQSAV